VHTGIEAAATIGSAGSNTNVQKIITNYLPAVLKSKNSPDWSLPKPIFLLSFPKLLLQS
jgi:hypothetical protein